MPEKSELIQSPYILAVTPNPSIDRAVVIPGFTIGEIHRPEQVISLAGGKGLNVARAIHRLGGHVKACLILAGHNGQWIAEHLDQERIGWRAAWADGETRISTSIIDPNRSGLTEIYERGDPVGQEAWERFEQVMEESLAGAQWATFSGSLPVGAPPDSLARLIQIVKAHRLPFAVDARGVYLENALNGFAQVVKINASEAGEILNRSITTVEQALDAAQSLRSLGAHTCIITLGGQGAVAVGPKGGWFGRSPDVPAIAPVGSGDSFLGALVLAYSRGAELPEALCQGIAAGAANAMTLGVAMVDPGTVAELSKQVTIQPK